MHSVFDRDIPECPVKIVPTKHTDNSSLSEYAPKLRQLLVFVKLFRKQDFWTEMAIWDRIYYKNVSQHRQSRYFKKFGEVRKLIKRLKEVNPSSEIARLYTSFYDENPLAKCKGSHSSCPTQEYANYSLHRIISSTLLLDRIQVTCIETYRAHQHLLNRKFFLPLTLVIMGLCSRTFSTCKSWSAELEELYAFMMDWKQSFPMDSKNASLSYQDIDIDSLKKARQKAFQELRHQRTSEFQPVHLESGNLAAEVRDIKFEALLEEAVAEISDQNGAAIDLETEDYGEILTRDNMSTKLHSMATDVGEIMARDDASAKQDSSNAPVSRSVSKKMEKEQTKDLNAKADREQKMDVNQKMEKKRKSNDALDPETNMSIKSSMSMSEKTKKKKKRKIANAELDDYNDATKGSLQESANSFKMSENAGIKSKIKAKVKSKSAVEKKSKGSSVDEIDDIFGF